MDSRGRLIMVGDEVKNNILIYDKSGKLLDSWGISYEGGHGLTNIPLKTKFAHSYLRLRGQFAYRFPEN